MSKADSNEDSLLTCVACEKLLREPIQLSCLHHCCRSCLPSVVSNSTNGETAALTCVACGMVTRVSDPIGLPDNRFIASLLTRHTFRTGPLRCAFLCGGDEDDCSDVPFEAADYWCNACQKPLCSKCLQPHGKVFRDGHEIVSSAACDRAVRSEASSTVVAQLSMCRVHKKEFDFYCSRCDKLKCGTCCQSCLGDGHGGDIKHVGDSWFVDRKKRAAEAVRAARDKLGASSEAIQELLAVPEEAEAARRRDIERLQRYKREVLDIVQKAFDLSLQSLEQHYDQLGDRAAEPAEETKRVAGRLSHAVAYADALLRADDEITLLQQEADLLPYLQRLGIEAQSSIAACSSYHVSLAIDVHRSTDFLAIVQRAVGIPRTVTPDDAVSSRDATPIGSGKSPAGSDGRAFVTRTGSSEGSLLPRGSSLDGSESGSSDNGKTLGASMIGVSSTVSSPRCAESPKTNASDSRIKAGARCRDIAFTREGRILLADGTLKEYEADSGQLLSQWSPAANVADGCRTVPDKVFAIGLLSSGSLVAGLLSSCRLLMLRREASGATWRVEDRSLSIPAHPVRLSAYGDMCAVSCSNESLIDVPATCVYLVSLSSNITLMNLSPGFGVSNLCLTKQALLVSSKGKQRMWDGSQCWVLDAYSHTGGRLWRQELYDEMTGMCVAPDGGLPSVWVAQPNRNGIATVALHDGVEKTLYSRKPGLERPWLLASCFAESGGSGPHEALLAVVCSDDDHLVSVHRLSELK